MAASKNVNSSNNGLAEIEKEASSVKSLVKFVTGSLDKLKEVTSILESDQKLPVTFDNIEINLPKLQGSPQDVAKEKCRLAAKEVGGAVLTEDTSLCYNALNGLPGAYIKCFLEKTGLDGLNKIISAYEDKTAYAQCIFAYCKGDGFDPELFIGKTDGKIVEARGPQNYGWDPIFQPEGCDKTMAEMDEDEKKKVSHRYKGLMLLKEYLKNMAPRNVNEKTGSIKNEDESTEEVEIKKADEEVEIKKADEKKTDEKKASRKRNREDEDEGDDEKPQKSSSIRRIRKIIRSG